MRSQAAPIVSPRLVASTPKAAAPRAESPPQSRMEASRRMRAKLRRDLPMFKSEHRFEFLGTIHVVAGRAGGAGPPDGRGGRDTGTARSAARRREPVRPRRHRDLRLNLAEPGGLPRVRAARRRDRLPLPRPARA